MDKIKELLQQMGNSEELTDQLLAQLNEWVQTERNSMQEEFNRRLAIAKETCMEEVAEYKQEVARKVEIFLESQVAAIEREVRGKAAIEESKAVNILKNAKAVLEDVQIDGQNGDSQALKDENTKLRRHVVAVTEDRDGFKKKHAKSSEIAKNALSRNRLLEEKVSDSAEEVIAESKGTNLEVARSGKGRTRSTRPTRKESQRPAKTITEGTAEGEKAILDIASQIDELV